ELLGQGLGLREIARHLGWGRHTVQRYARAARWQDMVKGHKHPHSSKLNPFRGYLETRWSETNGRITVRALHGEITERGFRGSYTTVSQWILRALPAAGNAPPAPAAPSIRQVTGWLTRHPATFDQKEQLARKRVLARCPELEAAAVLISSFAEMLTTLDGHRLPEWMTDAMRSNLPGISTFAANLETDYDAVAAGLTTPGTPDQWKEQSTGSRCSSGRCSAALASHSFANAFCSRDAACPRHGTCARPH
ncbi:hypothetical protein V7793_36015, partial [Streptomyces sp. KLMMK]